MSAAIGEELVDGTIQHFSNRLALDESNHQLKLMLARIPSTWLRKMRDKVNIGDATFTSENLERISEDATEELRRRALPMVAMRLAHYARNAVKSGVKSWLFITRLKRHAACVDNV